MSKKKSAKKTASLTLTDRERWLGWAYLAFELLILPSLLSALAAPFGAFPESIVNFVFYLINAVSCGLIFRGSLRASLIHAGSRTGTMLAAVTGGFLLLLGANQLMTGLFDLLIPGFVNANNAAVAAMVRENPLLMTLGTVLLVPVGEECLFRGLLFSGYRQKNRTAAYLLSVLGFCAIHVAGYIGQAEPLTLLLCFTQYVPAGIVLCASCEKTGSLFAPMLIHAAVNLCSILTLR